MDRQSLIRALRDTAQSASNAVASNVSGPVDLLAAGLRGVGLPIPESPVGGSQWMRDRGLTAPVQQGAAQVVGETLGMAGPALTANFAPQIARAANSLDDKAMDMARQGIEGQMVRSGFIQPATVWHGSPHKFDKFDSSKIGTGEGAQAYGHGLYLAESPDVAKSYVDALARRQLPQNMIDDGTPAFRALAAQVNSGADVGVAADALRGHAWADVKAARDKIAALPRDGSLYKVDLPDEQIAKMLDWDKPLSQQAPEVRAAWDKFLSSKAGKKYAEELGGASNLSKSASGGELTGENLLKNLMGANEAKSNYSGLASDYFRKQGIPGIRYLDGGSRGAGSGSSNFVVFPGNENILKILERNGQPLGMMGIK